jgi:BirA family biotin operon repressor/biotin-[acetyl-CoA-carboxylase] ligase
MSGHTDSECNLVIGIGLNMAMSEQQGKSIDQPWSDLTSLENMPNKTALLTLLQKQLQQDLCKFQDEGLAHFQARCGEADLFNGQEIKLIIGTEEVQGICRGIDQQGAVVLETANGLKSFIGGEISLRSLT